jgi:hypothetical protein
VGIVMPDGSACLSLRGADGGVVLHSLAASPAAHAVDAPSQHDSEAEGASAAVRVRSKKRSADGGVKATDDAVARTRGKRGGSEEDGKARAGTAKTDRNVDEAGDRFEGTTWLHDARAAAAATSMPVLLTSPEPLPVIAQQQPLSITVLPVAMQTPFHRAKAFRAVDADAELGALAALAPAACPLTTVPLAVRWFATHAVLLGVVAYRESGTSTSCHVEVLFELDSGDGGSG